MKNKYFIDLFEHFQKGGGEDGDGEGDGDAEIETKDSDKGGPGIFKKIKEKFMENPKLYTFIILLVIVVIGLSIGVRYLKTKIKIMRSELPSDFKEENFLDWSLGGVRGVIPAYSGMLVDVDVNINKEGMRNLVEGMEGEVEISLPEWFPEEAEQPVGSGA